MRFCESWVSTKYKLKYELRYKLRYKLRSEVIQGSRCATELLGWAANISSDVNSDLSTKMSYWAAWPPQPYLPASPRPPLRSNFSKWYDFDQKTCRGRNPSPQSGASISRWGGSPFLIAALTKSSTFVIFYFFIWCLSFALPNSSPFVSVFDFWYLMFEFWSPICWDDQHRNTNMKNKDHLVGQLTRGSLTCPRLPPLPLIPPWTGPPVQKISIR